MDYQGRVEWIEVEVNPLSGPPRDGGGIDRQPGYYVNYCKLLASLSQPQAAGIPCLTEIEIRYYNSVNFAPTRSKITILLSKNPKKFLDLSPVIRIKNDPVKVELFVEMSKWININSERVT